MTDIEYLERRAAVEAEMAQKASSPGAVKAHYEMSKAYFEIVEALKKGLPSDSMH